MAEEAGIYYLVNAGHNPQGSMITMMESVVGGLAVGDIDNDGWLDFYVADNGPNGLFRNLGDGTFRDVTDEWNARERGNGRAALFFDYDNDGWQDLLVVNFRGAHKLFRNQNGHGFADVTTTAGLGLNSTGYGAAAADIDRDGDLEVFVPNYGDYRVGVGGEMPNYYRHATNGQRNLLFWNDGQGHFIEGANLSGLRDAYWSFAGAFADYDRDGDDDLFVCNDFGADLLYRNDGAGSFEDATAAAGINERRNCMAAVWSDFDGDARLDLFVGNIFAPDTGVPMNEGNHLWHNRGDGTFVNVAVPAGVQDSGWSWGAAAFDPDNDGWTDLYVANGMASIGPLDEWYDSTWSLVPRKEFNPSAYAADMKYTAAWYDEDTMMVRTMQLGRGDPTYLSLAGRQENRFFHNEGRGVFQEQGAAWGLNLREDGRAVAVLDYDNDGDEDVLTTSRGKNVHLLENRSPALGHWLGLWLQGAGASNRDAAGAVVTVTAGDRVLVQQRVLGSGFISQSSPVLHFGLGDATKADRVEVRWPSGQLQVLTDVAADARYRLVEGSGSLAPV